MDAAQSVAQQLNAAESWGGHTRPHDVAWVLSLLLPLLPLDARARAACVCRAWRAATTAPALWEELSFQQCATLVSDAALAALCLRAGAALHALRLDLDACGRVTGAGMLAALRDGGCTGVRLLWAPPSSPGRARFRPQDCLSAEMVQQLAAACPMLELAACEVLCHLSDAVTVLTALPGPLRLCCDTNGDVTQLAECLRGNTTLKSLDLWCIDIGSAGVTQLAECLRTNVTLTSLLLGGNGVGVAGATQLAECLRVNSTLTSLDLHSNFIGDAGATQLAECLHINATLMSLVLCNNRIGVAGARQLTECLRVNATLKSLDLSLNYIALDGATELVECLHVNTTLTSLNLRSHFIQEASARAVKAACPPARQCALLV